MFSRLTKPSALTAGVRAMSDKLKPLIRVAVTGAAGQIGYSLLPRLASGEVFGMDQPIILQLLELDNEVALAALRGVVMEMQDCAFPLLQGMVATSDAHEAFANTDFALLVGAKPRGPGMERADLLQENGKIFQQQGRALNDVAKRSVQVIVVGNPANTNALICAHNAPDIPVEQFTALMRLDQDRAMAQLAERTGTRIGDIERLAVWGNHSPTMYPDLTHATVAGTPALEMILQDTKWETEVFRPTVQKRGAQIIKARGKSSAASAANASIVHTRDLVHGTNGRWISMAPASDGSYGIDKDIFCGLPCTVDSYCQYKRVLGLKWDDKSEELILRSVAELKKERELVREYL